MTPCQPKAQLQVTKPNGPASLPQLKDPRLVTRLLRATLDQLAFFFFFFSKFSFFLSFFFF